MPNETTTTKKVNKSKVNRDVKRAANTWLKMRSLRGDQKKGGFVDEAMTNRMINDMIDTYWDSIKQYLEMPKKDRDDSVEVYAFINLIDTERATRGQESDDFLVEAIREKVRKSGGSDGKNEKQDIDTPVKVNMAQKEGMREIAKWMYRNALRGGNFDWIKNISHQLNGDLVRDTGFDRRAYVQQIMEKSDQEKLLIYYLIENRKTSGGGSVETEDVKKSQEYVPDLERFKNRMIATRFKFWKRFLGSEIYWEKLGIAAQLANDNRFVLNAVSGEPEHDDESKSLNEATREIDDENRIIDKEAHSEGKETGAEDTSTPAQKEEAEETVQIEGEDTVQKDEKDSESSDEGTDSDDFFNIEEILEAGEKRNELLKQFHQQLIKYKVMMAKRDDLVEGTDEYEKNENDIIQAATEIQENLKVLLEVNEKLPKPEEILEAVQRSSITIGSKNGNNVAGLDTTENKMSRITGLVSKITKGVGGSGVGALSNLTRFVQVDLNGLSAINFLSGGLGALGAVANLVNIVGLVCDMVDNSDVVMTDEAVSERRWQIASVTMVTAQSISQYVVKIMNSVKSAEKTLKIASDATKSSLNLATQMLAGVGMVTEAANFGYAYKRLKNSKIEGEKLKNAKEATKKRRQEQKGGLSENERRIDVLDNILTRKNESKRRTAMIDMVGSAISFAGNTISLLGPASMFGMVVSLIGTGVKVIGTLWNLWETIKSKKQVVHQFFGIDDLYEKVKTRLPVPKGNAEKHKDKIKDELRHMVLAKLNLFSIDQGYYFAIRKMAELLYYKAFYQEDRVTPLIRSDLNDPKYSYVMDEYIPRIESLGFQPRYPAGYDDDYTPPITVEMLMVKLR